MKLTAKHADRVSGEIYADGERVENISILSSRSDGKGNYTLTCKVEIGRNNEANNKKQRRTYTKVEREPGVADSGTGESTLDVSDE